MIRESEVRDKLKAIAFDLLSVEDFADWVDSASWNMHRESSAEAVDLASSIHLLLAERDDGILSDADLRRELVALLNHVQDAYAIHGDHVDVMQLPRRFAASPQYWVNPEQPVVLLPAVA